MKRAICAVMCLVLLLCLCACGGKAEGVKTRQVESAKYSQEDIDAAIQTIKDEVGNTWTGCTLTEIYYAGDELNETFQDWAVRNDADEVIVLLSSFDVDAEGYGTLEPNTTYKDWNWILVRTDGGPWQHVDHGY